MADTRDYSKNYAGDEQVVKSEKFIGNLEGDVVGAITVPTATPASASAT